MEEEWSDVELCLDGKAEVVEKDKVNVGVVSTTQENLDDLLGQQTSAQTVQLQQEKTEEQVDKVVQIETPQVVVNNKMEEELSVPRPSEIPQKMEIEKVENNSKKEKIDEVVIIDDEKVAPMKMVETTPIDVEKENEEIKGMACEPPKNEKVNTPENAPNTIISTDDIFKTKFIAKSPVDLFEKNEIVDISHSIQHTTKSDTPSWNLWSDVFAKRTTFFELFRIPEFTAEYKEKMLSSDYLVNTFKMADTNVDKFPNELEAVQTTYSEQEKADTQQEKLTVAENEDVDDVVVTDEKTEFSVLKLNAKSTQIPKPLEKNETTQKVPKAPEPKDEQVKILKNTQLLTRKPSAPIRKKSSRVLSVQSDLD
ncbi:hypothetical protein EIN_059490 [Entamoeba invadens IP1]|uniref:hypothetical protein n=1 Tax=Entamoeba invadens IP1 TaxID=370355 RepID=UPI0002C3F17D|nr:hypothetical protein EIN_059490 [Entamoeba invadens IP1]ELP93464.1 hypothetical protein EIN_059490 [Entamoeba invadens IP1]|eukprot:XP_004260235.1 hypothetical protein EIN_059490 [Entamoeba invadens IP1]